MTFLRWFPAFVATLLHVAPAITASADEPRPGRLAAPVVRDGWVIPAQAPAAEPIYGIEHGIAVGLWPLPGPRGLIRIYAPYLGLEPGRPLNYIAVEPVVGRQRGLSEIEPSELDGVAGKRMWTSTYQEPTHEPRTPWEPARPRFSQTKDGEVMSFFIHVESFTNGARPIIQVVLRKRQPQEVTFRTFAGEGASSMASCVLTATMGNYARLRRLWLKNRVVTSTRLWPDFDVILPGFLGFTPPKQWGVHVMARLGDEVTVAASPDEADPAAASYQAGTPLAWRYHGSPATQYWRAKACEQLAVRVNGRRAYWGTTAEIPGGVAYENFELVAPFCASQAFTFGVAPNRPEELPPFTHADSTGQQERHP